MERRFVSANAAPVQIEEREGKPPKICGYAAVYYDGTPKTEYRMKWGMVERIMPGAFDRVMRNKPDIAALFNHDSNFPLGRTSSGTCVLSLDSRGLKYEIDPPNTNAGRDVLESIRRGDIPGSSFSFTIQGGKASIVDEGETEVRKISDFGEVFDVGPVTIPAYEGTTAFVRSEDADQAKREWEARQKEKRAASLAKIDETVKRITGDK